MYLCALLIVTCLIGEVVMNDQISEYEELIHLQENQNGFPGLFQNKCIEDLGCFWTGPPFFHPIHRPISRIPVHTTKTRFLLYTPSTERQQPYLMNLTEESVTESGFLRNTDTKILIHGYVVQLKEEDDIRFSMKNELLETGAYNVIIVDWSEHNRFPYSQAVANARVVGAQIAKLIKLLMVHKDLSPKSVHLIGHSLGGQMSGWVGERVPNLGRITGLDPAGPYFQNAENIVRLDTTDADFVDVIHTNGGDNPIEGLGIRETIGHMDFFPNGGTHQPGCFFNFDITNEIEDYRQKDPLHHRWCASSVRVTWILPVSECDVTSELLGLVCLVGHGTSLTVTTAIERLVANSCDHSRANLLFLESIRNCTFLATQCDSYSHFEKDECAGGAVVKMGLRTRKLAGLEEGETKFFLKTENERPFCAEEEDPDDKRC